MDHDLINLLQVGLPVAIAAAVFTAVLNLHPNGTKHPSQLRVWPRAGPP